MDWDPSWSEDPSDAVFSEQVNWELEGMENADVIAVFLGKEAKAPISLMELGLWARGEERKCVVCCPRGFWKWGNVRVVCERYGVEVVESLGELGEKVLEMLERLVAREKGGRRGEAKG